MLKTSIPLLAALFVWAFSSAMSVIFPLISTQIIDALDLIGEALFILGMLMVFARALLGILRPLKGRRSLH